MNFVLICLILCDLFLSVGKLYGEPDRNTKAPNTATTIAMFAIKTGKEPQQA